MTTKRNKSKDQRMQAYAKVFYFWVSTVHRQPTNEPSIVKVWIKKTPHFFHFCI